MYADGGRVNYREGTVLPGGGGGTTRPLPLPDFATPGEIGEFIEIYTRCPVKVCIERDIKGMYKKALAGEINNFTGVDDPYEEPLQPELVLDTDKESIKESAQKVINKLTELGYIKNN